MKKLFLIPTVAAAMALAGCQTTPEVSSVYIESGISILVGEKYRLTLQVSPPDADKGDVSWEVQHPDIVSIDKATGEVTGLQEGQTKVAAYIPGKNISAICEVKVEIDVLANIPDPALRAYFLSEFDRNRNGFVSSQEADQASMVNLDSPDIGSFDGIEQFQYIVMLWLSNVRMTSLDLSAVTGLTDFSCAGNSLRSVDISDNDGRMRTFDCEGNPGVDGKFEVRAWFDNDNVPTGLLWPGIPELASFEYQFSRTWEYQGETVTVDYQKVD